MMKTFHQFITEANGDYDPDVIGRSRIHTTSVDNRVGADRRKTEAERRRTKAAGGGKTQPAKPYKARKDIGTQRQMSQREQQPTRERGSAALSAKEAQKKAYRERKARERGEKTPTKTELLSKKTKAVDPMYKPRNASGLTTKERKALYKKGERLLRDIRLKNLGKKSEKELKHKITSK